MRIIIGFIAYYSEEHYGSHIIGATVTQNHDLRYDLFAINILF